MLDIYFTNKKKSGIEAYKEIEILDDSRVIVHFDTQDGMLSVFNKINIYVSYLYPCRYAPVPKA